MVIADARKPAITPRPANGDVTVQRDRTGKVCAYTYRVNGEHYVDLPGLGSFSFTLAGDDITAVRSPTASYDSIADAYRRTVLPLALQARGREVLHASAVLAHDRVVAVCGKSGMGKSTLVFALGRRGYRMWADDAVALAIEEHDVTSLPVPFKVRLKNEAISHFDLEPSAGDALAVLEPDEPPLLPAPLRALIVLERDEVHSAQRPLGLRRLPAGEAFVLLLVHGFYFSEYDQALHRRMVRHYLDVADRVPMFELRIAPGLERLDDVLDMLEPILSNTETAS